MLHTSGNKNDLRVVELVKASARKPLKNQLNTGKTISFVWGTLILFKCESQRQGKTR